MIKVMFVCLGNICRSPMAEFVLKDMVNKKVLSNEFYIKSSATGYEEIGNDIYCGERDKLIQKKNPFTKRKAIRLTPEDYNKYDFIIGMEEANISDIKRVVGEDKEHKIYKLLDFSNNPRDIADPWYTGNFEITYNDIVEGCHAFLESLDKKYAKTK